MTLVALLGSLLPVAGILWLTWRLSPGERLPLRVLRGAYLVSLLSVLPAAVIEQQALPGLLTFGHASLFALAVLALGIGFIEELVKLGFWHLTAPSRIRRTYDGLLIGLLVGLGFATVENLLYILATGGGLAALATFGARAVTATPMHAATGAMVGYFAARARFASSRGERKRYELYSWTIPAIYHAFYDYLALGAAFAIPDGNTPQVVVFAIACLVILIITVREGIRLLRAARGEPLPVPLAAAGPEPATMATPWPAGQSPWARPLPLDEPVVRLVTPSSSLRSQDTTASLTWERPSPRQDTFL